MTTSKKTWLSSFPLSRYLAVSSRPYSRSSTCILRQAIAVSKAFHNLCLLAQPCCTCAVHALQCHTGLTSRLCRTATTCTSAKVHHVNVHVIFNDHLPDLTPDLALHSSILCKCCLHFKWPNSAALLRTVVCAASVKNKCKMQPVNNYLLQCRTLSRSGW